MTEADWGRLRAALVSQFDEDIVQQVLLCLLQEQARGARVLDPLRWCRRAAARLLKNEYRRRDRERVAKETLSVLKVPLDNRSPSEAKRDQKRKERRRKTA